jgi:hypothetical protein
VGPMPDRRAPTRCGRAFSGPDARRGGRSPRGPLYDDIAAYEAVHLQILEMADMLSDGIIRQFPNKFAAGP